MIENMNSEQESRANLPQAILVARSGDSARQQLSAYTKAERVKS